MGEICGNQSQWFNRRCKQRLKNYILQQGRHNSGRSTANKYGSEEIR
jgi:hypothetical protein